MPNFYFFARQPVSKWLCTASQVIELFKASDKYDVPGLLRECIHIFHKITEARHVAYLLQACSALCVHQIPSNRI